jgi:RND family efflux transporter MFP subunit
VPLAETLGAFNAKRKALLRIPERRRALTLGIAAAAVGVATLVRWPLRVEGEGATFRAADGLEARAVVGGVIERVLVGEGARVTRGAPIARLRDAELRAQRDAAAADAEADARAAAIAASAGDAARERMLRLNAENRRAEARLLEDQLRFVTVRAPVDGVVLTPRPEERQGARVEPGTPVLLVGRTDTLELEMGVAERDVARVRVGQEVRLRLAGGAAPHVHRARGRPRALPPTRARRRRRGALPGARARPQPRRHAAPGDVRARARAHRSLVARRRRVVAARRGPCGSPGGGSGHERNDGRAAEPSAGRARPTRWWRPALAAAGCGGAEAETAERARAAAARPPAMAATPAVAAPRCGWWTPRRWTRRSPPRRSSTWSATPSSPARRRDDRVIHADLGAPVRAGQRLAAIESADQRIALAQAEAADDNARRVLERVRALARAGGATPADTEQLALGARRAALALAQARRDLELTAVVAPFDGVVSARWARPRRLVAPGDTLFRVTEARPLLARVHVPEDAASALGAGARATVLGPRGLRATATVQRVAPAVDAASATREVVLQVGDAAGLLPGSAVTVRLGAERRRVLAVRREAIGADGYALVLQGGRAMLRPVSVGAALGDGLVEVTGGLSRGRAGDAAPVMSARPKLRADVAVVEQRFRGEQSFVVKDRDTGKYFRMRAAGGGGAAHLRRRAHRGGVRGGARRAGAARVGRRGGDVRPLVHAPRAPRALAAGAIHARAERLRAERRRQRSLFRGELMRMRWSVGDPDRLMTRTMPYLRWCFTRGFVVASLVLWALYALVVATSWARFQAAVLDLTALDALTPGRALLFVAVFTTVVGIHELGTATRASTSGARCASWA